MTAYNRETIVNALAARGIPYQILGREIEADVLGTGHKTHKINPAKGVYLDSATGAGGTIEGLLHGMDLTPSPSVASDQPIARQTDNSQLARTLWNNAWACKNPDELYNGPDLNGLSAMNKGTRRAQWQTARDVVVQYLSNRGLDDAHWLGQVRIGLPDRFSPEGTRAVMITPMRRDGNICGIQQAFINDEGHKLDRKMLGRKGVFRLPPPPEATPLPLTSSAQEKDILLLGEGFETTAVAIQASGLPGIVAYDVGGVQKWAMEQAEAAHKPANLGTAVPVIGFLVDRDINRVGQRGARDAISSLDEAGLAARYLEPSIQVIGEHKGADWSDARQELGPDGIRAALTQCINQQNNLVAYREAHGHEVDAALSLPDDHKRASGIAAVVPYMSPRQINRALEDPYWVVRLNALYTLQMAGRTEEIDTTHAKNLVKDKIPAINKRAVAAFQDRFAPYPSKKKEVSMQQPSISTDPNDSRDVAAILGLPDNTNFDNPIPPQTPPERSLNMEQQANAPQTTRQYPRMEASLKAQDETWYQASLYADKEGQLKGTVSITNKDQSLDERHKVEYEAKNDKKGRPFLHAKVQIPDRPDVHVFVRPDDKNEVAMVSFTELKNRKHQQIEGQGGTLKPNEAARTAGAKDKTIQAIGEKLGVNHIEGPAPDKEKRQYPRMESALKAHDGTWYTAGVYADKDGQLMATVRINHQETGLDEHHRVSFEEREGSSSGRYYSAKIEREDKPSVFMNVQAPTMKEGDIRIARTDFTEFHPEEEDKNKRFDRIQGQGGWLKPNEAMLAKGDKDHTMQFMREKLNVDPVKQVEQAKAKAKGVER
ncbi:MAG: toprim domain-containing protein [Acidithiobacillus sp.]